MSANWEIWMFDKESPNQICVAMRCSDKDIGPFMEVCAFRYGLETIFGGTTCLKG